MHSLLLVTYHEVRTLTRERTVLVLFGVFLLLAAASSYIGWQTVHTTSAIYEATVSYTAVHAGQVLPPNPVAQIPTISSYRNLPIYIFLIGSLFAIVIGHRSFIREKKAGVLPLLFTRPLSQRLFVTAKLLGLFLALAIILSFTFGVSWFGTQLLSAQPLDATGTIRLAIFFALSLCYLFFFSVLGLFFAITNKQESVALFTPISLWILLNFALPELATGQTPTALLNPVTLGHTLVESGFFATTQRYLEPISLSTHYTIAASAILSADQVTPYHILVVGVVAVVSAALCILLTRHTHLGMSTHE